MTTTPTPHDYRRGLVTLAISLIGALLLVVWASARPGDGLHFAGSGYLQAWAGACFKAATGAYGGYWICRGLLRIDISEVAAQFTAGTSEQARAAAAAQLARGIIVAACVLAICLAP